MTYSQGGVTGGLSIDDALREFEGRGYVGQFVVRPGGSIECTACHHQHEPKEVPLESMLRIEGSSDPADMVLVGAMRCPECGSTGTAVVEYGPNADADHGRVLRAIDDHRMSHAKTLRAQHDDEDDSLVRDSGWLRGPDG